MLTLKIAYKMKRFKFFPKYRKLVSDKRKKFFVWEIDFFDNYKKLFSFEKWEICFFGTSVKW